jgi:CheY-like chemotaxis protein
MDKRRLLIVDDSPEDIQFLLENLKDDYALLVATSAEKALEIAGKDPRPEVILMDVVMPGMDGYDACRALKQNPDTQDINVIFVSANNTVEEKLLGYDVGGRDYLIKPIEPKELLQKIELSLLDKDKNDSLAKERSDAFQTAMTAMQSGGELGVVLEFLRGSFKATDTEALAQMIIQSLGGYSLSGSVQIRTATDTVNVSTNGRASPIEQELMVKLKDSGRIIERQARLIMNFGDISLLVKNMPTDNSDVCGRLRDHLAILLEGAESKLAAIELYLRNEEKKSGLQQLVFDTKQALLEIKQEQELHKEASVKIVDRLLVDLQDSFLSWGLTEEQESRLLDMVYQSVDDSISHYERGLEVDEKFEGIVQGMNYYAER